ncbi:ABC transporter ATP-binding protein [Metabacillus sp. GX 13764]|uniref:ABC transporter ATP-binding protein n=1 Tax=Metabacillus kandeliae TaxID=2900151 RepID=UPI001E2D5B41|nr:ABC transporter ATP-binding protein [Metabacillus kandeliae]MCD7033599.1 ABC transporter ATP-binding protein [Metabacillus kandeliae]
MSQDVTLAVENLKKSIKRKEIIKNISFKLHKGEVFGFLGPNGAGKTTTIRMLVGLIKPSSGRITICGKDLQKNFSAAIRHIGCIVENPELYTYLSGRENLEYFLRMLKGVPESRIDETVKLVRLENRINDKVSTYSLGMKQRLGIAQALLSNPEVLILDEPTNGLDPMGIREMREFIRFLAEKEGLTVLVSSHLLSEIQLMCDRVAIMSKGKILKVDSVSSLLTEKERVVWHAEPVDRARKVLSERAEILPDAAGRLVTANDGDISKWNKALVEEGIEVKGIDVKLPSLEDLFIELTEGESID